MPGKGATVMFFGLASPEDSFPLKPDDVFKKELHITSSFINPYTYEESNTGSGVKDITFGGLDHKYCTIG